MKMKLFQVTQQSLADLGITPAQSVQKNPFNQKILTTYFWYLLSFMFFCVYVFYLANNFREYTTSIYMTAVTFVALLNYTISVFRSLKIFELIQNFEKIFEERK